MTSKILPCLLLIPGVLLSSSCYLTSSFDGLTGAEDGSGGGGGGASSASNASSASSASSTGGGMGGDGGGSGGMGGAGGGMSGAGGSGGIAKPATPILDDFDRPEGPPGPSWALAKPGAYVIDGGRLRTIGQEPDAALWSQVFGPRQEVYVTIERMDGDEKEIELILRNQGHPSECESLCATFNKLDGPDLLQIWYCTEGAWHKIGHDVPVTLKEDDVIRARGYEDGLLEVFVNDHKLGTWDASAAPMGKSGGRIGVFTYQIPDRVRFDDFGGGEF